MELTWQMRIRVAAAAAVGVVIIGILGWPLAKPFDPMGPVIMANLSASGVMILLALAILTGIIANFLAWPFGPEMGIIAVPSGLAYWAIKTASVGAWIQAKATLPCQTPEQIVATVAKRQEIFGSMKWEPLFWLLVVIAGFVGVTLGQLIKTSRLTANPSEYQKTNRNLLGSILRILGCTDYLSIIAAVTLQATPQEQEKQKEAKSAFYLNAVIGLAGALLIAHFFIRILVQDVAIGESKYGTGIAQPFLGQIIFGVFAAFAAAAFVVKKFLDSSYICPIIATGLVAGFTIVLFVKPEVVKYFVENFPANAFPNSVVSVLPIQMVAFGTLGAITGYWAAIRYGYWRKHEIA